MHILKPHDIVVALKIGLNEQASRIAKLNELPQSSSKQIQPKTSEGLSTNAVADLANDLGKGKGDISRSITRLLALGLVAERRRKPGDPEVSNRKYYSLNRQAMFDLLTKSIRHVFAPDKTGYGRGVPTGWNCPHIQSEMNPPDVAMVWPLSSGKVSGEYIEPLYEKLPEVIEKDKELYAILSMVDVIRIGKPREIGYAKDLLEEKIMGLYQ